MLSGHPRRSDHLPSSGHTPGGSYLTTPMHTPGRLLAAARAFARLQLLLLQMHSWPRRRGRTCCGVCGWGS